MESSNGTDPYIAQGRFVAQLQQGVTLEQMRSTSARLRKAAVASVDGVIPSDVSAPRCQWSLVTEDCEEGLQSSGTAAHIMAQAVMRLSMSRSGLVRLLKTVLL